MIGPDSKIESGAPPPIGSSSTIAGIRPFGEIFRKSGVSWSPRPILIGLIVYGSPSSSSRMTLFLPLPVGQKYRSIIRVISCSMVGARQFWLAPSSIVHHVIDQQPNGDADQGTFECTVATSGGVVTLDGMASFSSGRGTLTKVSRSGNFSGRMTSDTGPQSNARAPVDWAEPCGAAGTKGEDFPHPRG